MEESFSLLAPADAPKADTDRPGHGPRAIDEAVSIVRQLIQNPSIDNARRGPLTVSDINVVDLGRFAKKAASETISGPWTFSDSVVIAGAHYVEFDTYAFATPPAAPGAGKGRLFFRINGTNKVELAAIFPSGTIVPIVQDV